MLLAVQLFLLFSVIGDGVGLLSRQTNCEPAVLARNPVYSIIQPTGHVFLSDIIIYNKRTSYAQNQERYLITIYNGIRHWLDKPFQLISSWTRKERASHAQKGKVIKKCFVRHSSIALSIRAAC